MQKILMIIPADDTVDVSQAASQLVEQAHSKSISTVLFMPIAERASRQSINIATAEKYLAQDRLNELLEMMVEHFNHDVGSAECVVIQGLNYQANKPYIAALNRAIAQGFAAKVILVSDGNNTAEKIIAKDYDKVIGVVSDKDSDFKKISLDDLDWLRAIVDEKEMSVLTPPMFNVELVERAKKANKRIILPEGTEVRTIRAANICAERQLAHCILMGKPDAILKVVESEKITLHKDVEILDPDSILEDYVGPLVELRKHKGMTPERARKELADTVVLGTMMLAQDKVDGLVSGAVHTTANTIRPALQFIRTAPNAKLVSSIFFMCLPNQVITYSDCAINPNPTSEELADIAIQSADSAAAFGIEPRVAMISYSTGQSGFGPDVDKVREATSIVKNLRPDILVDGPLQYDAAIVPSVGKSKAPDSPVAGRATVFIFPDLNTGNTTYKAVQRGMNIVCVGPMLQGLNKPVNDLSRGCLVEDIVFTIALTAVQAAQEGIQ